ncbi:L-glutamate gamma-semialdehyde dehydrogenase [Paraburkholderia sp. ZP32-5]|uniref:L-glutamate gamma-semialdehyde dehydrogenase n=1 Tax=Paraburkholderia sp. ZP32-5 TaxID=2883245 RepID=UPI001F3B73F3|nr:L-glutamate gamma-semialdehyde dehydrogenase [Paraburkholderia sp. ZP32-5]
MNESPILPMPDNEIALPYGAGSPERNALDRELRATDVIEIPAIVGGQEIYSGDIEEVRCPHDHARVLARVHRAQPEHVNTAIRAATETSRAWAALPWWSRAAVFSRAAALVGQRHRASLNAATMLGQSKTLSESDPDAACELMDFLRFNAWHAQRIAGEQPLSTKNAGNRCEWRPLEGFVYAASPFNFTAIGANLSCGPAMMGNGVVWKPSPKSVLANYRFFRILQQAGLPDGVINFVPGDAAAITDQAMSSRDFAGLHFTGSSSVFKALWAKAGANIGRYRSFPRLVGETGGKDFVLAHPGADMEPIAEGLVRAAYEYQGQKCSAASRAYIPRSMWPRLRERLCDRIATLEVGDVASPDTFMGALIDRASFDRITQRLAAAREDSALEIVAGGTHCADTGYFVDPALIVTRDPDHALLHDELFGPVLTVFVYEDDAWDDTLRLIDRTSAYALTGSIYCHDRIALMQAEQVLMHAAGNLYVNDKPTGAMVGQQPFGGGRASGTNDKAGSWMNLLRWTSPRTVKDNFAN